MCLAPWLLTPNALGENPLREALNPGIGSKFRIVESSAFYIVATVCPLAYHAARLSYSNRSTLSIPVFVKDLEVGPPSLWAHVSTALQRARLPAEVKFPAPKSPFRVSVRRTSTTDRPVGTPFLVIAVSDCRTLQLSKGSHKSQLTYESCVVLPEPVSPTTTTMSLLDSASRISDACCLIGRWSCPMPQTLGASTTTAGLERMNRTTTKLKISCTPQRE